MRSVALVLSVFGLVLMGNGVSGVEPAADPPCPAVADTADGAPFALATLRGELVVPRGASAELPVCTVRRAGFTGSIRVSAVSLPDGITTASVSLRRGSNRAVMLVTASREANPDEPWLAVIAADAGQTRVTTGLVVRVAPSPDHGSHEFRAHEDDGRAALASK